MPDKSYFKHYSTVAKAIDFLQQHAHQQPSLDTLASHIGMSATHFQRVFSQWAGVSPKRFLQFITKQQAKQLLLDSKSVLDAALESGLSGPSRLHDLLIQCEAVTPGEYSSGGKGVTIRYGYAQSPFGQFIAGLTDRGLCHLQFLNDTSAAAQEEALAELRSSWQQAQMVEDVQSIEQLSQQIFTDFGQKKPLSLLLCGTNFQIKVWEALLHIPAGNVATYSDIARLCQQPNAQRAVGSAIGRNNIAMLIPCHRVIRATGEIGQYRWGDVRKTALLTRELAQSHA